MVRGILRTTIVAVVMFGVSAGAAIARYVPEPTKVRITDLRQTEDGWVLTGTVDCIRAGYGDNYRVELTMYGGADAIQSEPATGPCIETERVEFSTDLLGSPGPTACGPFEIEADATVSYWEDSVGGWAHTSDTSFRAGIVPNHFVDEDQQPCDYSMLSRDYNGYATEREAAEVVPTHVKTTSLGNTVEGFVECVQGRSQGTYSVDLWVSSLGFSPAYSGFAHTAGTCDVDGVKWFRAYISPATVLIEGWTAHVNAVATLEFSVGGTDRVLDYEFDTAEVELENDW